ncbi:MAG: hypothetical protein K0R14_181 [Burkholderiales bacterium]|jgi:hypothetical protein|nr:hypothetical protein [Burkholderiales bacterium]
MELSQLFSQARQKFSIDTPQRAQERATFTMKRVAVLQNLDLSEEELTTKIDGYLGYSLEGVFNALAFNPDITSGVRSRIITQVASYSFMYKLKVENLCYSNLQHNTVRAFYNEIGQPKIAVICIGNDNNTYRVLPFADKEELQLIIKNIAIEDCFKQFEAGQMDDQTLVYNILQLHITRDEAFKTLLQGVNYDISKIILPLKNEFTLETQLDKLLRSHQGASKIEKAIIRQLKQEGSLELYTKTRLDKNSILSEAAKQRLIAALDT